MNSTVCQSNASVLNIKTVNAVNDSLNIVFVSCGKDVFMLSHEKCVARYALSKDFMTSNNVYFIAPFIPLITEYLVNISKRRSFWSLNEDILKINYSDNQYAVSIKEDTAYLCLHSPKTTKETSSICHIFIRASRLKKIPLEVMAELILEECIVNAQNESNISITSNDINIELNDEFLADDAKHCGKTREKEKTVWEELVEKNFCKFYPESYDGEEEMLYEGDNWGIDPLEFISRVNSSFDKHMKIDGRTKKVLFHAWMNGSWNKRRMDDSILNDNNTTTDSFFKPYLITHEKCDTEKEDEQSQTKRKYCNVSESIDEQPNKIMCKAEKFEAIQYSLGPNEEYIAIERFQSIDFKLKLQHQKEKIARDVSWKSSLSKLNDENVLLKTQVDSVVKERENIKLEYQKLFNLIKATQTQHQQEVNELIESICKKTYAYGDVRFENQDLLMIISELKNKLKTFEKGKGVNTKFDKSVTF
ncbi:hypothetical protein Tco_0505555 [Tanacetum coccineum]